MKQVTIKNYKQAADYLNFKTDRPYANNTRISLEDKVIVVRLHGNPIVRFYPDHVTLNNCGWRTLTTKERMNRFLPDGFAIYQHRNVWYIRNYRTGDAWLYFHGIQINCEGQVMDDGRVLKPSKESK